MLRRVIPYIKKMGGGFVPITFTGLDIFAFNRLLATNPDCIRLTRPSDSGQADFGYSGDYLDLAAIDAFSAGLDTDLTDTFYGQNNLLTEFGLTALGTARPLYYRDGLATDKSAIHFNSDLMTFAGTLADTLARNLQKMAVTMLVKADGTVSGAVQTLFYVSTHTDQGRTKARVYITPNPVNGFAVDGRRASADSATTISDTTTDANNWNVVTAIWDYNGSDLVLRVNGVQKAINTSFGSGANSENNTSLRKVMGFSGTTVAPGYFFLGGMAIWTNNVSLSEIQSVEDIFMDLAGI